MLVVLVGGGGGGGGGGGVAAATTGWGEALCALSHGWGTNQKCTTDLAVVGDELIGCILAACRRR